MLWMHQHMFFQKWIVTPKICRLVEVHILAPDSWFSDAVVYPRLHWLSSDLLVKLVRWATECRTSEFSSTLSLLPVEKYSLVYQQLKDKYKAMVKVRRGRTLAVDVLPDALHVLTFFLFCCSGLAWGDRSWEVCLRGRCHCYVSHGEFKPVCRRQISLSVNNARGRCRQQLLLSRCTSKLCFGEMMESSHEPAVCVPAGAVGWGQSRERSDSQTVVCGHWLWKRPPGSHPDQRRGNCDAQFVTKPPKTRFDIHIWTK